MCHRNCACRIDPCKQVLLRLCAHATRLVTPGLPRHYGARRGNRVYRCQPSADEGAEQWYSFTLGRLFAVPIFAVPIMARWMGLIVRSTGVGRPSKTSSQVQCRTMFRLGLPSKRKGCSLASLSTAFSVSTSIFSSSAMCVALSSFRLPISTRMALICGVGRSASIG
jgi:hypothetical protein